MVCDNKLRTALSRFLHDRFCHIERTKHARDLLRTIAAQQADIVPAFRQLVRSKALHKCQNILNCRHFSSSLADWMHCTSARWYARRLFSDAPCSMPSSAFFSRR